MSSSHSSQSESESDAYEVEKILDHRVDQRGHRRFLIQWKGYGPDENTWEDEANLNCPDVLNQYLSMVKETRKAIAPKGKLIERPAAIIAMGQGRDAIVRYRVQYKTKPPELLTSAELRRIDPALLVQYLEARVPFE